MNSPFNSNLKFPASFEKLKQYNVTEASLTYNLIFLRRFLPVYWLNFAGFSRFLQKSLNRTQQGLPCSHNGKLPDGERRMCHIWALFSYQSLFIMSAP